MQNETEKSMFLSVAELNRLLPWSKNIIARMIREGVFRPVRNPLAKGRSKMFFWRPQVDEAIRKLVGNAFEEGRKEAEPCA
ncbi:MAG: hypothetical protein SPK75_00260 [Victivallales bacterium]|nr:hypothetical protein [bacterium]MDD7750268.1 hypothetical protein [bacterium]MDY5694790.1 hypothetical protein [Victivallales bacterium]